MEMPGRKYNPQNYRYGFNGMEKDDDLKGSGNSYTTEYRMYDSRLGRWLSTDPAMAKYPGQSPYVAFNNNPLFFTDPLGNDPPEGLKKHSGQGGDIYLPESAKINTRKNSKTKADELTSFTIGSRTFSASYNKGQFMGYYDGRDKYVNPNISYMGGGIKDNLLNVMFQVTGVPADGLQLVQTLQRTAFPDDYKGKITHQGVRYDADGMQKEAYKFSIGSEKMQGEVDGGIGSTYSQTYNEETGKPYGVAFSGFPYYISGEDAKTDLTWNKDNGRIRINDKPSPIDITKKIEFTSIIVAVNYMNTGKDLILGTFRWGWDDHGKKTIHSTGINLKGNTPNSTEINIINHFYRNYEFFK